MKYELKNKLAGLLSAKGVKYTGDEDEKALIQLCKLNSIPIPEVEKVGPEKVEDKKGIIIGSGLKEDKREKLLKEAKALGLKGCHLIKDTKKLEDKINNTIKEINV